MKIFNYVINMTKEDTNQEFRLKKIRKIRYYFFKEIDQSELIIN